MDKNEYILTEEYCRKYKAKYLIYSIALAALTCFFLYYTYRLRDELAYSLLLFICSVGVGIMCLVVIYRKQNMLEHLRLMQKLKSIEQKLDENHNKTDVSNSAP
ncbi:MAG TPA: hypothetical protein DET40_07830 [Lentisphaeria bacterium]|nr:MAG: hypothetical protein A2X45_11805 [Lentisphaerae bacterium GWF2_50_93]HCE43443.1 hypothetical protein [Lentisphaeria bacterium]